MYKFSTKQSYFKSKELLRFKGISAYQLINNREERYHNLRFINFKENLLFLCIQLIPLRSAFNSMLPIIV